MHAPTYYPLNGPKVQLGHSDGHIAEASFRVGAEIPSEPNSSHPGFSRGCVNSVILGKTLGITPG